MKVCSTCCESKPLADFGRDRSRRDGYEVRCRPCICAKSQAYAAANHQRELERQRLWREANREYSRAKAREYREAHPDRVRAASRAFKKAHPEMYRAYEGKRRAQAQGDAATAAIPSLLLMACAYCGGTEHIEVDHVIPLSRGGLHEPENLAPACRSCNRSKGAKLLSEWLAVV